MGHGRRLGGRRLREEVEGPQRGGEGQEEGGRRRQQGRGRKGQRQGGGRRRRRGGQDRVGGDVIACVAAVASRLNRVACVAAIAPFLNRSIPTYSPDQHA